MLAQVRPGDVVFLPRDGTFAVAQSRFNGMRLKIKLPSGDVQDWIVWENGTGNDGKPLILPMQWFVESLEDMHCSEYAKQLQSLLKVQKINGSIPATFSLTRMEDGSYQYMR
jgi:hypothetical protein